MKCYSQKKGIYQIRKNVEITHITFRKSIGNKYSKHRKDELVELRFQLGKRLKSKDKVCFLVKYYSNDSSDIQDQREKEKEEIDLLLFYDIIEKLNQIDVDKLKYDFNVVDGITNSIIISGDKYQIYLEDNWKDIKKAKFYALFESIWEKYNQ